jgi:hypothetical protein
MATVLEFPAIRPSIGRPASQNIGAEIVFFPGVRFERREAGPEAAPEGKLPERPEAH